MSTTGALWLIAIGGFVLGWCTHGLMLQLAYRMGIVEYKGKRATHQGDHK